MTPSELVGAVVIHDGDAVVFANDAFCRLVRAESPSALAGMSLSEFVSKPYRERLTKQFSRVGDETPTRGLRLEVARPDGTRRDAIAVSSRVEWEGTDRIHTSFMPVAPREDGPGISIQEDALEEAPIGVTIADATSETTPLVYVNKGFLNLTGYARDEVLGQNCRFLQGEGTHSQPIEALRGAIANEVPVTVELRNYRKNGTMFWNRVTLSPVEDRSGTVTHFLGFQEDISEEKRHEREKSLFKKHAESADHAMFTTDAAWAIEYVNPAFEQSTGYSADEVVGKTPAHFAAQEGQALGMDADAEAQLARGEVLERDGLNRTSAGERYRVRETVVPLLDDRGNVVHYTVTQRDVTEDRLKREVMDVLNRVLRHNVRSSVSVIDGHAELLEMALADPDQLDALRTIRSRTDSLAAISDQMTTIRHLLEGYNDPKPLRLDRLPELVEAVRSQTTAATLSLTLNGNGGRTIRSGNVFEVAFKAVLEYLLAQEHSCTPVVDVAVTRSRAGGAVCVTIRDDCSELSRSEWDIVTAGEETPLEHTSGIELWILYWAMTAMGGSAELETGEGRGSTFTLEVPLVGEGPTAA